MSAVARQSPWPSFWTGCWRSLPVALVIASYGVLLGVNARLVGVTLPELVAQSLFVFAGTSQLLSVDFWGQPLVIIWLATLAMNFRYLLIGASLRDLFRGLPLWRKLLGIYYVADENWALTLADRAKNPSVGLAFLVGSGVLLLLFWQLGGLIGYLAAGILPEPEQAIHSLGLDFVVPAIFIALSVNFFLKPSDSLAWVLCGLVAVTVKVIWPDDAWHLMAGPFAGLLTAALVYRLTGSDKSLER